MYDRSRRVHLIISSLVVVLSSARIVLFAGETEATRIRTVPDDAFLYLQMARNWAENGIWSLDGSAVTTGFHALYGHILGATFLASPDVTWSMLYLAIGVASSLIFGIAAYLLMRAAEASFGGAAGAFAGLPFLAAGALTMPSLMMESALVVLFAALGVYVYVIHRTTRGVLAVLLVVGVAGSLSRTDFGVLPLALALPWLVTRKWDPKTISFLSGSVVGLLIVGVLNFATSGQVSQGSTSTKLTWTMRLGPNPKQVLQYLLDFFTVGAVEPTGIVIGLILGVLGMVTLFSRRTRGGEARPLVVGALLALAGYGLVFLLNSYALQPWHAAVLLTPLAVLGAFVASVLPDSASTHRIAIATAVVLAATFVTFGGITHQQWPHQSGMLQAARQLTNRTGDELYAAWNAGILAFNSEGTVVNLDGLANNEVLPYIQRNDLDEYILLRGVTHIADYLQAVSTPANRLKGGFDGTWVDECLRPESQLDTGQPKFIGSQLWLYKVDRICVRDQQ